MAAKSKLTPEQWKEVRTAWEGDARDGYAWLVEEFSLPVSVPGVRKKAICQQWEKTVGVLASIRHIPIVRKPVRTPVETKGDSDPVSERQFQLIFVHRLEKEGLLEEFCWPDIAALHTEYRVGSAICDVVTFHSDGSVTVFELKRGGLVLRDYMTGIGQLVNASVQFGLAFMHQNVRRNVRLVLSVPGEANESLGYACLKAGVEYLPFGAIWDGSVMARALIDELHGEASNGKTLS